jgi:hypothetical protein
MKIISGMLGVLMLTLLALPSEAKSVYSNVISRDLFSSAQNLEDLDAIIMAGNDQIGEWFKIDAKTNPKGDLKIGTDQAFVIRGGRGTIGEQLDQLKQRNIVGSAYLRAYGCYKQNPIGKDNATYVIVSLSSSAMGIRWCTESVLISGGVINVGELSKKVKVIRPN